MLDHIYGTTTIGRMMESDRDGRFVTSIYTFIRKAAGNVYNKSVVFIAITLATVAACWDAVVSTEIYVQPTLICLYGNDAVLEEYWLRQYTFSAKKPSIV